MAFHNVLRQPGNDVQRPPGPDDSDTPHALQRVEHQHADVLQAKLQQRDHEHQDVLQERLQRREHQHQHALLDRQEPAPDPLPDQLALVAIIGGIVLNGTAMLLGLGHTSPEKMAPFAAGLIAAFVPTVLAWTIMHKKASPRARTVRYLVRLLWLASVVLFAAGSVFAGR